MALHRAVARGDVSATEELLKEDMSLVDARGYYGESALHAACLNGHPECIQVLMRGGADVQSENNFGLYPIHYAVVSGHLVCVRMMIEEFGALPSVCVNKPNTVLHSAAESGQEEIVQYLVEELEMELDVPSESGLDAVELASQHGHTDLVAYFKQLQKTREHRRKTDSRRPSANEDAHPPSRDHNDDTDLKWSISPAPDLDRSLQPLMLSQMAEQLVEQQWELDFALDQVREMSVAPHGGSGVDPLVFAAHAAEGTLNRAQDAIREANSTVADDFENVLAHLVKQRNVARQLYETAARTLLAKAAEQLDARERELRNALLLLEDALEKVVMTPSEIVLREPLQWLLQTTRKDDVGGGSSGVGMDDCGELATTSPNGRCDGMIGNADAMRPRLPPPVSPIDIDAVTQSLERLGDFNSASPAAASAGPVLERLYTTAYATGLALRDDLVQLTYARAAIHRHQRLMAYLDEWQVSPDFHHIKLMQTEVARLNDLVLVQSEEFNQTRLRVSHLIESKARSKAKHSGKGAGGALLKRKSFVEQDMARLKAENELEDRLTHLQALRAQMHAGAQVMHDALGDLACVAQNVFPELLHDAEFGSLLVSWLEHDGLVTIGRSLDDFDQVDLRRPLSGAASRFRPTFSGFFAGEPCFLRRLIMADARSQRLVASQVAEMRKLGQHPNINVTQALVHPSILSPGQDASSLAGGRVLYFQVDRPMGGTLREWRLRNRSPPAGVLPEIATRLLQALEYLHVVGVPHGDLCPDTVWMTRAGEPIIGDYDLGNDQRGRVRHLQQSCTTNSYMSCFVAPELLYGGSQALPTHASDMYSFGATLYWLVFTRNPPTPTSKMMRQSRNSNSSDWNTTVSPSRAGTSGLSSLATFFGLKGTTPLQQALLMMLHLDPWTRLAASQALLQPVFAPALNARPQIKVWRVAKDRVTEAREKQQSLRRMREQLLGEVRLIGVEIQHLHNAVTVNQESLQKLNERREVLAEQLKDVRYREANVQAELADVARKFREARATLSDGLLITLPPIYWCGRVLSMAGFVRRVDVTSTLKPAMEWVMNRGKSTVGRGSRKITVVRVERIENALLWRDYATRRGVIVRSLGTIKTNEMNLAPAAPSSQPHHTPLPPLREHAQGSETPLSWGVVSRRPRASSNSSVNSASSSVAWAQASSGSVTSNTLATPSPSPSVSSFSATSAQDSNGVASVPRRLPIRPALATQPLATHETLGMSMLQEMEAEEHFLFHCITGRDSLDNVMHGGLCPRKMFENEGGGVSTGSERSLGSGIYFSESVELDDDNSTAAERRNDDDDDDDEATTSNVVLVSRVVLGCTFATEGDHPQLHRPPCMQGHTHTPCHHSRFHSVIGLPNDSRSNRQFVVYERTQAYPEYAVYFE